MSKKEKLKKMYISVDLISQSVSPVQYYENDYSAYQAFTNGINAAKKSNTSLSEDDFCIVYIGTIRNDGLVTPDYRIITKESVSNVQKMKEDFINSMKENISEFGKSAESALNS